MSTVTYILNNNKEITFKWDGLSAFDFLEKVHQTGEELDEGFIDGLEIVSINIQYNFPKHLRMIPDILSPHPIGASNG